MMSPANEDVPTKKPGPALVSTDPAPAPTPSGGGELDWISPRIAAARAGNSAVSDSIAKRVEDLLRGHLALEARTKSELAKLATELIVTAAKQDIEQKGAP
jgi:hypothetical protein